MENKRPMKKSPYNQLCCLPGITDSLPELKKLMTKHFGLRFKMVTDYTTYGGRRDVLFYVHDEDIAKFALRRMIVGIMWWEDALANDRDGAIPYGIREQYPATW